MPVQGWYLDDETYRRLLEEAGKQARKPGEILSEIVRTELSKRVYSPCECLRCVEVDTFYGWKNRECETGEDNPDNNWD